MRRTTPWQQMNQIGYGYGCRMNSSRDMHECGGASLAKGRLETAAPFELCDGSAPGPPALTAACACLSPSGSHADGHLLLRRSIGSGARGGGGGAASGKYQVGAARNRAAQKEQDDILARLPRGPRADRDPDEGPGLGGGFQGYGGDRGERLSPSAPLPLLYL